jgi:hypothetical protein
VDGLGCFFLLFDPDEQIIVFPESLSAKSVGHQVYFHSLAKPLWLFFLFSTFSPCSRF